MADLNDIKPGLKPGRFRRRREGFSLLLVLMVAVVGMAILGVAFHIYESARGQAESVLTHIQEYNALQSALERGKNHLLELVNNAEPVPRWFSNPSASSVSSINGPDMLIIERGKFSYTEIVHGESAKIEITIYDANYDISIVDNAMSVAKVREMPSAQRFEGGGMMQELAPDEPGEDSGAAVENVNAGVYLIRAKMTIRGASKTMEASVVQRNNA